MNRSELEYKNIAVFRNFPMSIQSTQTVSKAHKIAGWSLLGFLAIVFVAQASTKTHEPPTIEEQRAKVMRDRERCFQHNPTGIRSYVDARRECNAVNPLP